VPPNASPGVVSRILAHFILPPESPLVQARIEQCLTCPHSGFLPGAQQLAGEKARQCALCGCFVHAKVRKKNEHCPDPEYRRW